MVGRNLCERQAVRLTWNESGTLVGGDGRNESSSGILIGGLGNGKTMLVRVEAALGTTNVARKRWNGLSMSIKTGRWCSPQKS